MKREERRMERYRASFQRRFRFAAKRFCEFELKFLQATTPPTLSLSLSAIIVPHRIHVAPFFPALLPLVVPFFPPPQQRHGENQFVTDIPRRDNVFSCIHAATSKWEVGPRLRRQKRNVTRRETVRCFHDISSRACVYIFGLEFILFITAASLYGDSLSLSLSLDTLIQQYVGDEERRSWTRRKKRNERGERETLPRDPRRLIRRDSVYHTAARSACLPDCSIFLHTYLNYWNCSITIFHWFIDASSRFFLSFFLLSFSRGAFSLCSFLYCFFLAWLRLFLIEKEEPLGVFVYKKLIKIKNLKEISFVAFWKEWRF